MIKYLILFAFVFFLLLCNVSAISTNLKSEYSKLETVSSQIMGNILEPISSEQVEFKRGDVIVPFEYDIINLNGTYYLWFISPENENNYTLYIKNIRTTESGVPSRIDYSATFSVTGNFSEYTIRPGAILTDRDFEINVFLNEDEPRTVDLDFPYAHSINLKPGDNKISISIEELAGYNLINIKFGEYTLPAFIKSNKTSITKINSIFRVSPKRITREVYPNSGLVSFPFRLYNNASYDMKNLVIVYNSSLFDITLTQGSDLRKNSEKDFNITLKKPINYSIDEYIELSSGNETISISLSLIYVGIVVNNSNNSFTPYSQLFCFEVESGKICDTNQNCIGDLADTLDDELCCLGVCENKETTSKSWIGFLIAGVLILAGALIYLRYSRTKYDKNVFKNRVDIAEKKRTGSIQKI